MCDNQVISAGQLIKRTLGWFGLILLVQAEGLFAHALPEVSGPFSVDVSRVVSPLALGIALSVCMLPWGAYRLAGYTASAMGPIIYGVAGALLYQPLFLLPSPFRLFEHPLSSAVDWSGITAATALCCGSLCWAAAVLRRGTDEELPECADTRMGIKHLMLWTLCTAVYMALVATCFRLHPAAGPNRLPYVQLSYAVSAIGAGGSLLGGLLFVVRRVRGLAFPRHPGEFLLITLAAEQLFDLAMQFIPVEFLARYELFGICGELPLLSAALILLIPARRPSTPRIWRIYLYAVIAAKVGSLLIVVVVATPWYGYCCTAIVLAPVLLLVPVLLLSRRIEERYPWTHWFGAGMFLWSTLPTICWLAASSLGLM
jgi:hypothetical protein